MKLILSLLFISLSHAGIYSGARGSGGGSSPVNPSLVQKVTIFTTTEVATQAISFSALPASGHAIVVAVSAAGGGNQVGTITDNQGNSYTQIASLFATGGVQAALFCAVALNPTGTFTMTAATVTGSTFMTLFAFEYAGITCATDGTSSAQGTTSPYGCGSFTTRSTNGLVAAVINNNGSPTAITGSAGFTVEFSQVNPAAQAGAFQDQVASATGTFTPTFAVTPAGPVSSCVSASFPRGSVQ